LEWTHDEADSFRRGAELTTEQRVMSTVDTAGGFLAPPLQLDPTILISSAGSINPLRAISRIVTIATDIWQGVTSAGITAEWLGEAAEAADASPNRGRPTHPGLQSRRLRSVLVRNRFRCHRFRDRARQAPHGRLRAAVLTNTAFTTGTGSGQPTGIITALAASSPTVVVNTGTADTLLASDVYGLQAQLPLRFQANASRCANLSILNALRQMETTNGALKFPSLQEDPPTLLGRNVYELSNMDGVINAGAENYILAYGDFSNFVIVDRFPASLEPIQNLFGTNRRPTGQRGLFALGENKFR
jgi:predicted phage gp36 major capsid-like protein